MANEYINRDAVIELLVDKQRAVCPFGRLGRGYVYGSDRDKYDEIEADIDKVQNIPAADVVERKIGKWEEVSVANTDDDEIQKIERVVSAKCPYCHKYHNEVFFYGTPMEEAKYCPNCGADLR